MFIPEEYMSEARPNTKVKEIVMSYQQYHRSTSNPIPTRTGSPTSNPAVYRKPTATYSPIPHISTTAYRSVTQPVTPTPKLNATTAPSTSSTDAPLTPASITNASSVQPLHTATSTSALSDTSTGSLSKSQVDNALQACLNVLTDAITYHSKRPFSALLLGPDAVTVLQTHNSISHVQHAESELARLASIQYSADYLSKCTLVSTWEPCAMCAGTIYWSGIGRLLYAAMETTLKHVTGDNNEENLTMNLPCRHVFAAGQRQIEVIGPVPDWERKVVEVCTKWWDDHRLPALTQNGLALSALGSRNTSQFALGGNSKRDSYLVLQTQEEHVDSVIGEDGEYKADLKVDWF